MVESPQILSKIGEDESATTPLLMLKPLTGVFRLSKDRTTPLLSVPETATPVPGKFVLLTTLWVVLVSPAMLFELTWTLKPLRFLVPNLPKTPTVPGMFDLSMLHALVKSE